MISLDRLNRVIEIDAVKQTVTVEAGIRIRDLSRRYMLTPFRGLDQDSCLIETAPAVVRAAAG